MAKEYKTLIFDLEGTLVGLSHDFYIVGTQKGLKELGVNLWHETIVDYLSHSEKERPVILESWGIVPQKFYDFWSTPEMVKAREHASYVYADVIVLEMLKERGVALGLATGAKKEFLDYELPLVERVVGDVFHPNAVVNTGRTGEKVPRKPAPDCVNKSIEALVGLGYEVDKETTAMIGNADEDVLTARNAGIDSIIVERPNFSLKEEPTIRIPSLMELLKYVRKVA